MIIESGITSVLSITYTGELFETSESFK